MQGTSIWQKWPDRRFGSQIVASWARAPPGARGPLLGPGRGPPGPGSASQGARVRASWGAWRAGPGAPARVLRAPDGQPRGPARAPGLAIGCPAQTKTRPGPYRLDCPKAPDGPPGRPGPSGLSSRSGPSLALSYPHLVLARAPGLGPGRASKGGPCRGPTAPFWASRTPKTPLNGMIVVSAAGLLASCWTRCWTRGGGPRGQVLESGCGLFLRKSP